MAEKKRVLLVPPYEAEFSRSLVLGVGNYAMAYGPWELDVPGMRGSTRTMPNLDQWRGDGILMPIVHRDQVSQLDRNGVPYVNVTAFDVANTVRNDNDAIATTACEHLYERGFRRFAYFEANPTIYSAQRAKALTAWCMQRDLAYSISTGAAVEGPLMPEERGARARAFLPTLRRPCGLVASNDEGARALLEEATAMGIRVPQDLGIIGVDNELFCQFTRPTLSSVIPDGYRVGFEAAAMLDRLMKGGTLEKPRLIPPKGVAQRESTDALVMMDEVLAEAVRFIRSHGNVPLEVWDVLREVPASRRTLERRFMEQVGHTPAREIRLAQIAHVKKLLTETDWKIERVARASAFRTIKAMGRIFKNETGLTPGEWREKHRVQE